MTSLGPLKGKTQFLNFNLVNFDWLAWHDYEHDNWIDIDVLLQSITGILSITGVWKNNTTVTIPQRYSDREDGTLWECLVDHTTAATPTLFSEDRAANPGYWTQIVTSQTEYVGVYANDTDYALGVYASEYGLYGISSSTHTSPPTGTMLDDPTNWNILIDIRDDLAQIEGTRWRGIWGQNNYLRNDMAIEGGWLGIAVPFLPEIYVYSVIDHLQDDAREYASDHDNDWLSDTPESELKELGGELDKVFKKWMKKTGNVPDFFCVDDVVKVDEEIQRINKSNEINHSTKYFNYLIQHTNITPPKLLHTRMGA